MTLENYDIIIGLEIHVQLNTNSKMFCSCSAKYFEKEPNSLTCPVCLGMPGTLPVPNRLALEKTILLGLATHCKISPTVKFDRKHYFYPDLPKGYQISQYDNPICYDGYVTINSADNKRKEIALERIHQEEDVAKSFHIKDSLTNEDYSLIDFNKSGVPLTEIVTKPVIESASDARIYAERIRQIVRYFNISEADMEKGQMRCEPNVSVQKKGNWKYENGKILAVGNAKLYPKVEIKNIGSISAVEKSLDYEIKRLIELVESGEKIIQQTRGWNAQKSITEFQRSKESAPDYGYFKDPDIPLIVVSEKDIESIKKSLGEIPEDKELRYKNDYKLSDYDIKVLTFDKKNADYFEQFVDSLKKLSDFDISKSAKLSANWITGVIFNFLNSEKLSIKEIEIEQNDICKLIIAVENKKINNLKAKELLSKALKNEINFKEELTKIEKIELTDDLALESIVKSILEKNPQAVTDYKNGKVAVIGFLIGQAMKELKGNGDPGKLKDLFISELK